MTVVRTFTPDEVERFQPRARHFYHQHGSWDGGLYTVWVAQQWATFKTEHGIDERWGSSVETHDRFTQPQTTTR